jgi:hypothetical protein
MIETHPINAHKIGCNLRKTFCKNKPLRRVVQSPDIRYLLEQGAVLLDAALGILTGRGLLQGVIDGGEIRPDFIRGCDSPQEDVTFPAVPPYGFPPRGTTILGTR